MYSFSQSSLSCWNETSTSYSFRVAKRVIWPSIVRKNGLICDSSEVGSSKNSRAMVWLCCERRPAALRSTR